MESLDRLIGMLDPANYQPELCLGCPQRTDGPIKSLLARCALAGKNPGCANKPIIVKVTREVGQMVPSRPLEFTLIGSTDSGSVVVDKMCGAGLDETEAGIARMMALDVTTVFGFPVRTAYLETGETIYQDPDFKRDQFPD